MLCRRMLPTNCIRNLVQKSTQSVVSDDGKPIDLFSRMCPTVLIVLPFGEPLIHLRMILGENTKSWNPLGCVSF